MKHILFLFSRFKSADMLDIASNFMIKTSCTTTSVSAADTRKCEATLHYTVYSRVVFLGPLFGNFREATFLTPPGPKKTFCQKKNQKSLLSFAPGLNFFPILKKIQVPGCFELR